MRIFLTATLLLFAQAASAQQILGTNPVLGGYPVSCNGAVAIVAPVNDLAQAVPGQIILNPVLFQYPPVVQIFVYAHECAHQFVGSNEPAADCWAVKLGRNQGWLPPQAVGIVASTFVNSPGNWTHAPGPVRAQQMAVCYNTP